MALSTSRTVITQSGLTTTQSFNVGGILAGTSNLHTVGIEVAGINVLGADTPIGTGSTIYDDGGARFSGIVSATKFVGDISDATGAAAGLGTALSQTQTDPLNKIYYTNKVLSISTTTTIDHPATANLAYTQYGDIKIEDGHDLIIKDGDDFKYDILGISTTKLADNHFPNGLSGDLTGDVTGNLTGNVNNSTLLLKTGGNERFRIDSSGRILIGTTTEGNGDADEFTIANTGGANMGMTIRSATDALGNIFFSDGTSGDSEYRGMIQYGHNNDSMRFSTSATERFRIDSSGNVTKPTSFHILVDRDGNQTGYSATGTTGAVIWNRVRTSESSPNAANHFNTSTGIFTAPVTGLYFFHAAVNCNYNVEGAWLILNGSRPNFSVFNPNSAQTSDGAITYHLTAGDEVGLKWYQNGGTNRTINSNVLHTWWRIILLG